MSVICFRSVQPNISIVDQVMDANNDVGSMYSGIGEPPICSSTDLPLPSRCVVCFLQFIYAVCSDLLKNVTLVMEGGGLPIDLIKSECPSFSGASKWWLLLLLLIVPVIIFLLVAAWKYGEKKYSHYRRGRHGADSSEAKTDADSAV
ncbi:uncharacterized protein PEZ65_004691 [Lycodopsis pacificus]